MDLHLNELIIEEGYDKIPLYTVSFRNIDQEFVIVHTQKSYDSLNWNNLYYCFIKPYEGIIFRLIGISDEEDNAIKVDEDKSEKEDFPYSEFENEIISKIIENGDLLSNQLIVDIPFDYYSSDIGDLKETRKVTWLDDKRITGNPDWIQEDIDNNHMKLRLIKCIGDNVVAENEEGLLFLLSSNGSVEEYEESVVSASV